MNKLRNSVNLIGNLGRDPEIFTLDGGREMTRFSVATTEYYKNREGDKVEETQWHNCVAFGKSCDLIKRYVKKGEQIALRGKIEYRSYQDKEGKNRKATQILVDEVVLLAKRRSADA